ncbi:hypothetical protein L6164_034114 [Bauhinia variegata]|uniref:Uncharacterized protein n=1 Tax=Bauhinia variegata TaxID=167791 RepID=A0ACB9KUN7_BAUVA|nr:hypothetical protein L6164_034114 [Bauhinia variegata]
MGKLTIMALQRHYLLPFFFIIISFVASRCTNLQQEDPLYLSVDDLSSNDDGGTFKNLIKQSTDVLTLKSFGKLGNKSSSLKTVNVDDYGAEGDSKTDDTKAFEKAWEEACSSEEPVKLVVPEKSYLLMPTRFSGPCESNIDVQISGCLEASDDPSDYSEDRYHWIIFDGIENLSVQGGGTIHGNGNRWWKNSCKRSKKKSCKHAPTAVTFYKCKDLLVRNLTFKDAQQMHVSFQHSTNVKVSGLTVTAPGDSPNTDGIHVTNTENIQISSSTIATGDDCISIVSGSKNVQATNITCGPGHGISIGSLGKGKSKDIVSDVTVDGAKFSGTSNGVRIKTWQGGSGSVTNIKFQNIEMDNATNPIIINQYYCDQKKPCKEEHSAVQIMNVTYRNIKGTSAHDVAVKFDCSKHFPCQGIVLQEIGLQRQGGEAAEAYCKNVQFSYIGDVFPRCPEGGLKIFLQTILSWFDHKVPCKIQ